MSPKAKPDAIDGRTSLTLDELTVGVPPFISWDELDIPDLTDLERAAFADALDEDRAPGRAEQIEAAARAVVDAGSELSAVAPGETWEWFDDVMERLRTALEA
jgi:hypothetical protein